MASLTFDADSVQVREHIEVRDMAEGNRGFRTLSQIPHPVPERESANAIFRYRFLRKGGAAMLIATSGVGKSVFTVQAAILWAMGEPMVGIQPVRPLRITIIQGEDDDDDMGEFRDDIIAELAKTYSESMRFNQDH